MKALVLALSAALAGQVAERPPTVRIVSLPDSYAPDLAPGEVLVPGSVYDVATSASASASTVRVQVPAPSAQGTPYAVPAPPAAYGSSSCYSSSYGGQAYSYAVPAPPPAATYVVPSNRPPIYSTPMQTAPVFVPQYAQPAERPRRGRFALRWGLSREYETRGRTALNFGIGDGARNWREPSLFNRR
jgi:hypothetical protein